MINTVIFDIGNVLAAYDWQTSLKAYGFSAEKYEILADAVYRHTDWNEMDRGVLTVEEVTQRFISHAPQYAEDIRRLITDLHKTIWQFSYTKPLLKKLRAAGYRLYYLSNYGEYGREQTADALDFISLMDGGLFSYEVQMVKPNRWIYAEVCRRFDICPEEAIFFDDNRANVLAAREMGLQAEVFTSPEDVLARLAISNN